MKYTRIHNPAFSSPLHSLAVDRSFCPGWSLDSLLRSCLSALDALPHCCIPARRSVPLLRRAAVQLPAGPADGSLNPCQSTSSMYCCITSAVAVSVTVLALQESTPELFARRSALHSSSLPVVSPLLLSLSITLLNSRQVGNTLVSSLP